MTLHCIRHPHLEGTIREGGRSPFCAACHLEQDELRTARSSHPTALSPEARKTVAIARAKAEQEARDLYWLNDIDDEVVW